ncbi:hypothetical protein AURANDRAFT_63574 [Aureococcus anophagefferens]|uniref:Uncharacterized protein n=2 Tax=Aureococcus anophagefferens TaxID=44056 RepID=F0Y7E1_AURAN|nr:hypothetical protein AURANDRAFT_63574 [Aureococcus anophagefferens]EGB09194.1 hypothetical protein AURANDRAFT_63574 [Aureococcus anophagefferens]|eukprot:XP_009036303.1 hypothetical protein AURANDRAFT_63574 [Aureococcus anophagefferens]
MADAWGTVTLSSLEFSGEKAQLPYVQVLDGKKRVLCKTGVVRASGPEAASFGGEALAFDVGDDCGDALRIDVRESKTFHKGTIGAADVPTAALLKHAATDVSLALRPGGCLKLVVRFADRRPLYGLGLEAACARNGGRLPLAVEVLVADLDRRALALKGVYRVPGDSSEVRDVEDALQAAANAAAAAPGVSACDASAVASALKKYFAKLPVALLRADGGVYEAFVAAARGVGPDAATSVAAFRAALARLPRDARFSADALFAHLRRVADRSDENMMNSTNLGVCFGPTLFHAAEGGDPALGLMNVNEHNAAVTFLVEHAAACFGAEAPAAPAAAAAAPPLLSSSPGAPRDDADLAAHFAGVDDDGDGLVDGDGLEALAYCLGVFPAAEPAALAAARAGPHGRYDAREVARWWRAVGDGRPTPPALDAEAYTMVTYFLSFDEAKVGFLDANQFASLHEGLLEGGYDLPNAADTMDLMDVNRNGTVSYAEFIAWFQGLLRSAASA